MLVSAQLRSSVIKRTGKPFAEFLEIGKVGPRHQKLQEGPQFGKIVLQRCPREEKPAIRSEHEEDVPSLGLEVLDHMRFIQDHIVPSLTLEYVRVPASQCIRCDADIEVVLVIPALPKFFATFRRPVVAKHLKAGQKLFEFHLPIQKNASRDDLGFNERCNFSLRTCDLR